MKQEEQQESVGENAEQQGGQAAIERDGSQSSPDRRRFLKAGGALAAGGAVVCASPQIVYAVGGGALSPSPMTPSARWIGLLQKVSTAAARGTTVSSRLLAKASGMDQDHIARLGELQTKMTDLDNWSTSALMDFENLCVSRGDDGSCPEQDTLTIPADAIVRVADVVLDAVNEGLQTVEENIPQIPTGGITNSIADGLDDVANDLDDVADSWDNSLPGSGVIPRAGAVVVRAAETVVRILTLPCS